MPMQILIKIVVNAVALWAATAIVDGMDVGGGSTADKIVTLIVVAVIFGLVNAIIKPVVKLVALPFYILTLGLITFIINALMLWITDRIAGAAGFAFDASPFFWTAVLGAIVVGIVSFLLQLILPDGD